MRIHGAAGPRLVEAPRAMSVVGRPPASTFRRAHQAAAGEPLPHN
jgi:hypothetical protein